MADKAAKGPFSLSSTFMTVALSVVTAAATGYLIDPFSAAFTHFTAGGNLMMSTAASIMEPVNSLVSDFAVTVVSPIAESLGVSTATIGTTAAGSAVIDNSAAYTIDGILSGL